METTTYKISDIGEVVGGGTPSTANSDFWGGDIPWISPKDLTGYKSVYISHGENFLTKTGLKSGTKLLPKGTVLFSSRAPIGYVAIASKSYLYKSRIQKHYMQQRDNKSPFLILLYKRQS